jgi:hypothetical protein
MAEISGQIIAVLPTRSGTSAKGTAWSSQTAVIETREQYPKKVAFDVMGEKITQFNLRVGEYVTVSYDIDAHEYQGRWFNAVRAWNVVRANQPQQTTQQPLQQQQQAYTQPQQPPVNAQPQAPFPPQQQAASQG